MKITLMRQQLYHRHNLNCDCGKGDVGNNGAAAGVVMGWAKSAPTLANTLFANFNGVRCRREVGNRILTEIGGKEEIDLDLTALPPAMDG
jgi:hypothetical protein